MINPHHPSPPFVGQVKSQNWVKIGPGSACMVDQYILCFYLLLKTLLVDVLWPRRSRTSTDTVLNIYMYIYVYIYMFSVRNSKIVIDGHLGPPLMQSLVIPVYLFPILVPYSRNM